jgi:PAS domain S-box-containing protein
VNVQVHLIGTLLRAALEETGAQHGLLIQSLSGEPRIAAEATRCHRTVVVRLRDRTTSESLVPASVLDRVLRTREIVVIDNATDHAAFAGDSYVRQDKTGSILCLPLANQTTIVGALLLESHAASGAFTPARLTVLKLMSSLAASAIENSRLYGELQEREVKIRRLVDANIIGIYIIDLRGPIIEANDAYLRMLGYDRNDLISGRLRWTDLTPPEWHAADKQRVERVKGSGACSRSKRNISAKTARACRYLSA